MKRKEAYEKLREIDKKTTEATTVKLGLVTQTALDRLCKALNMNRSRFIRIAISHFDSYLSQLSDIELAEEVRRMKKFD